MVVGPDGEPAAHHRKVVTAERRWASPGRASRSSMFDTPWGRVGVLICADSYFGLLPRYLALNGVDLLLILANWPPSGIDPKLIWRARALENGFGVVGCNRTGVDRIMDCRACRSYAVTSTGEVLLDEASPTSKAWMVDYPMARGRLTSESREAMMALRRPEDFEEIYLDVNGLEDFGGMWGLPSGGPLDIRCLAPASLQEAFSAMEDAARECGTVPTLLTLPQSLGSFAQDRIARLVADRPLAIVAELTGQDGNHPAYGFISSSRLVRLPSGESAVITDFGPARLALTRPESLAHPEVAISLSKQGCDLLVTSPDRFDPDDRLVLAVKSLEQAAIVVTTSAGAMICEPPVGHAPWKEELTTGLGVCSARIDTTRIRLKRFHDRVDMEALLRR